MRKIKVVVLLVRQLQHGFTKNAKVSPNLTVTHIVLTPQSPSLLWFIECRNSSEDTSLRNQFFAVNLIMPLCSCELSI